MRIKLACIIITGLACLIYLFSCTKPEDEPVISASEDVDFRLSDRCPPGFELTGDGTCKLRSLYQQYESLYNSGVGGLKTALPPVRDGFTPQQIDLGRYLFFDPVLSKTGTMACASCHNPALGFSDGKAESTGLNGQRIGRSAPSLWNVAFLKSFFWDARASSLEEQMQGPLFSPVEMANTPESLLKTLNSIPRYVKLFDQAFPDSSPGKITLDEIYTAIAAFESSLISLNSRYDQYAHGYHAALSEKEIKGLNVFRSFVARCAECHTPPLFTNQQVAVLGVPEKEGKPLDPGVGGITGDPSQKGAFKVPSLRNIALTAPYMHAGNFSSLEEVIRFYNSGRGHALPENEKLYIHWHIWTPDLTDEEIDNLVSFLHTLTDTSFMPPIPVKVPSGLKPVYKKGWMNNQQTDEI